MYFNIIIYTFYVVNFIYYTTFVAIRKGGGLDRELPAARAGKKKKAADKMGGVSRCGS